MSTFNDLLPQSATLDNLFTSKELQKILASSLLDPLSEFLSRPAKNIRSQLVEMGYRLAFDKEPKHISAEVQELLYKASSIVELIHSGSLIVDDIQDSSSFRREQPALHIVHGIPLALNAGNWLYFWALSQLKNLDLDPEVQHEVTDDILSLMMKAHAGQALDVGTRIDLMAKKNVRETCLASMELKSGTLMSLALRLGAGIAGKKWKKPELFHLGSTLGMLLQMYDDIGNFITDSPKKYEDLNLRRPTWVWAVASQYDEEKYETFIECLSILPDETLLQRWMKKNHFREKLFGETEMFRTFCEVSWHSDWEKTHPDCISKLNHMTSKLERMYVR